VLQEDRHQQQQQQQVQDNNSNVSLVMVSAKGRVAVYHNQIQEAAPLKLVSSFTLRLSAAPVAGLKGQSLSSPSTTAGGGKEGRRRSRPTAAATNSRTYNNSQAVQKVFFSPFSFLFFEVC
jgi:hypothetical protein